jgi:hypothetical protein
LAINRVVIMNDGGFLLAEHEPLDADTHEETIPQFCHIMSKAGWEVYNPQNWQAFYRFTEPRETEGETK